ncbi:MAG: DUF262 domain-containing protein [Desulfobulbaceae bacterium]|jgi:hypothetical protein|nr:DUF262 domain-containing protein [Desulfobulbaceae bacterium]
MTIESGHKDIRNLIIGDNAQFHIPIYQRTYTWEAKKGGQVEKLINDIIEFSREYKEDAKVEYYIGNIIVKNQTRAFQPERVVIDGQQRITTTILLLCAIRDVYLNKIKTPEALQAAKNIARALFSDNDGLIKLKLNNMEHQNTLRTLLTGAIDTITATDKYTRYWDNYQYLYKKLSSMEPEGFQYFVDTLDRIKVVIIFLDDAQDENSVFESINSLGKPLSGSDLIKNFLFTFKNYQCSHNEEKVLTDIYTRNFESLFSAENDVETQLEIFFRQYIALKTSELVNQDPKVIYYSFKKLVGDIGGFEECKDLIKDITKWGIIFQTIRANSNKDIRQNYIGYLKSSFLTYATLLMDIVEKCSRIENGTVVVKDEDKLMLNETLRKVVAYDVCRLLGGFPAKQITRFTPTIPKRLKSENPDYHRNYAAAFEKLVTSAPEGYGQPSLNKLRRTVVDIDLYNRMKKQVLRFLVLMENEGKKELLSFEKDLKGCEIEHIMPQTMTPEWQISKEDHERYLHTLGNLSITFNNQGLSNKSFTEKKEILQRQSRINLNQLLLNYDTFDKSAICDRSLKLLNMFAKAYGLEDSPDVEVAEALDTEEISIFEAGDPTSRKLQYAVFFDERLAIRSVTQLYEAVFRRLFSLRPELFFSTDVGAQIKLTEIGMKKIVIQPVSVDDAYVIEACLNSRGKFDRIKCALSVFGFEDKLRIKYAQQINQIDSDVLLAELD